MALTITEALSEINTISKRIAKKQQFVSQHLMRQDKFKDPLEGEGGSESAISAERDAIRDLEQRSVNLRLLIAAANNATVIGLNGKDRSIAEWLVWRRDIAPERQAFLTGIANAISKTRQEALRKGVATVGNISEVRSSEDVIVHVNEKKLSEEIEALEKTLGDLDGQLSLKNATVTID